MRHRRAIRSRTMHIELLERRSLLSTLIALVDTGVELNGPYRDFYDMADAFNSQTNEYASVKGDGVVRDTHGHGTVLTNQTMVGVLDAKSQPGAGGADVRILPVSYRDPSTGASSYAAILRGIRYAADKGAAVINVSLGEAWNFSATGLGTISQAVQYAEQRGSVVVAPSGNRGFQDQSQGWDVDRSVESAIFPAFADDPTYNQLGVPLSNLLVAAAVDSSGNLTSASNWGPIHVDVGSLSNSEGLTSYSAGYASGVTGVIAALTPGWSAAQRVDHMKQSVEPHPQSVGSWSTTGGNISPAKAVRALERSAPASVQVVDDAGSAGGGYAEAGPWTSYAGLGHQADHSAATGVGASAAATATATWTFSGLAPGRYRVLATWVPADNRATDAPFTVDTGGAPATLRIDQTDQASSPPVDLYESGRPWWALGGPGRAFDLAGSELVVRLGNDAQAGRFVVADAVRAERIADIEPVDDPRIVDDAESAEGGYAEAGPWTSYAGLGHQADHSAATGVGASAAATATATWTFSGLAPGRYRVLATWVPADNRATDAPFTVDTGGAPATLRIDQTDQASSPPVDLYESGRPWWALGGPGRAFDLAGSELVVRLGNDAQAGRFVVADAVRAERIDAL